jgi:hypothetical protein
MDDLDLILVTEEPLVPSSGFRRRVMDAVHSASMDVTPRPFPWRRLLLGVVFCIAAAAAAGAIIGPVQTSIEEQLAPVSVELAQAIFVVTAGLGVFHARRVLASRGSD